MDNYENFVFYGSWRETLEGFRQDFGDDYAKEALWNLMTCATAGDFETQKKSIVGFITGCCMPNVNSAKERYERAVENGKKGGRPKTTDDNEIKNLREKGLTNQQVASQLGVSVSTVEKANKRNRQTWLLDSLGGETA